MMMMNPTIPNPSSSSVHPYSSSPIHLSSDNGGGGGGYLIMDPHHRSGGGGTSSASGSFQNNDGGGFLDGGGGSGSGNNSDVEFGFLRPEILMQNPPLVGTVEIYHRHVFLCYKNPKVWPPHVEAAEFDRLPRLLSAALLARKHEINKQFNSHPAAGYYYLQSAGGYMPPVQPMNDGQNYYMQQPNPNVVYVQQPLPNQFYNPGVSSRSVSDGTRSDTGGCILKAIFGCPSK